MRVNIFLCLLLLLTFGFIFLCHFLLIFLKEVVYIFKKYIYYGNFSNIFKSRKNSTMNVHVFTTQHCQHCSSTSFPPPQPPPNDFIANPTSFHLEVLKHNHSTILIPPLKRKKAFFKYHTIFSMHIFWLSYECVHPLSLLSPLKKTQLIILNWDPESFHKLKWLISFHWDTFNWEWAFILPLLWTVSQDL